MPAVVHPPLRAEGSAPTTPRRRGSGSSTPSLERLRAAPAEPIAIERIAEMAGVARSTVYAIFGSRGGLFDAVGQHLHDRAGYARLVEESHRPDARAALRGGLRAASAMLAADRDLCRALRSMAQLDPEAVGGAVQRWEEERAAAMAADRRGSSTSRATCSRASASRRPTTSSG